MTRHVIIMFGPSAIGKTYQSLKWIEKHPEYTLMNATDSLEDIKNTDYVVMDYYFAQDNNADKLRELLGCPVDIWVLFDKPERFTHRQLFMSKRTYEGNLGWECLDTIYTNIENTRFIKSQECRYLDCCTGELLTYEGFKKRYAEYMRPFTKEEVKAFLDEMEAKPGYDKHYHHISLPHGFRIGKDNYAMNEETWAIIKDWVDWPGALCLDLCCFHAIFCQYITKEGGSAIGIDRSPTVLYSAAAFSRMNNLKFRLFIGDVENPLPDFKSFYGDIDVVLVLNFLHHLKDKDHFLFRMQQYPLAIFEINKDNRELVEQYFTVVKEAESPKFGRVLLLCKSKRST